MKHRVIDEAEFRYSSSMLVNFFSLNIVYRKKIGEIACD